MKIQVDSARWGRWLRFFVGGITNTVVSYLVYLALMTFLLYQAAYGIAYVSGILFSYWFNSKIVFKVPLSLRRFLAFPLVYVVQYAVSALLLGLFVSILGLDKVYAPLFVAAIMVPFTYVVAKAVLYGKRHLKSFEYI